MNPIDDLAASPEVDRIRKEYERRGREIPPDRYSWIHAAERYRYTRLWSSCIEALASAGSFPLNGKTVLDIGCGPGRWLAEFCQWGADPASLAGVDLLEDRIRAAKRLIPNADIRLGDASRLPWQDEAFDVVTQFTVLSSILDAGMRRRVAGEMVRLLKPGGVALSYDLAIDSYRNPHVTGISAAELRELFPNCKLTIRRSTLAPPISRVVAKRSWILALALEALPVLRSHYLAVVQK